MSDEAPNAILLNETDRHLVWMATRLLAALEPGEPRMTEVERLIQDSPNDVADAHSGTEPALLDDMATNFGGALLLRMTRNRGLGSEALGRHLRMVDPRH